MGISFGIKCLGRPCQHASGNARQHSCDAVFALSPPWPTCPSCEGVSHIYIHLKSPTGTREMPFLHRLHHGRPVRLARGSAITTTAQIILPQTSATIFAPSTMWPTLTTSTTAAPHRGGPATKSAQNVAGTPPGAVHQARKGPQTVAGPYPPRWTCYEKRPKRSRHTTRGGGPGTKRAQNRGRSLPTAVDLLRKAPKT